jgi:hypothetical protein
MWNIRRTFYQILETVRWSLSKNWTVPTLILLYSAIDIAAWLNCEDPKKKVRERFVEWVERYMKPESTFSWTALDLYGARCGTLHSFGPDSELSKNAKVRKVLYASAESDPKKLAELISLGQMNDYVVIHIDHLYKLTRNGIETFLDEAERNPSMAKLLNTKASTVFESVTDAFVDEMLRWGKSLSEEGN